MKSAGGLILCAVLAGCAGSEPLLEEKTVPYKAVVAFEWPAAPAASPEATAQEEGGGGPSIEQGAHQDEGQLDGGQDPQWLSLRQSVERQIEEGLEAYQVFSDFTVVDKSVLQAEARRQRADLMVIVRMGDLARWDARSIQIVPGFAVLNTLLWLATGFGGWWIPDTDFPTNSQVEVSWRRVGIWRSGPTQDAEVARGGPSDFKKESLASGNYRLSFWDRAKPWGYPLAYLVSLLVPPALVPLRDSEEVSESLVDAALGDFKRELAMKLKGGSIGSGGAPFLFRLEDPPNRSWVDSDSIVVRYRYSREPGFETDARRPLYKLYVYLKREKDEDYKRIKSYDTTEQVSALNEILSGDSIIEEEIKGLEPGLNLVLFLAQTELERKWITNTIALFRR